MEQHLAPLTVWRRLCAVLNLSADCYISKSWSSQMEYQIATEVFGRPPDFDPHLDSAIRVQLGRLN